VTRADELRAEQGLPPIGLHVTPHTLRYTYKASTFAAGADQEYVASQGGHENVTTTNRIYRYVLRRRPVARSASAAGSCSERSRTALSRVSMPSWPPPERLATHGI
jgi:integrase